VSQIINIKRGDTKGIFVDTLKLDGVPIDLTGSTLKFLMRRKEKPYKSVDQTGQIVAPVAAEVQYQPVVEDVDTSGVYEQEWEVTFPSGKILTFPNASGEGAYNTVNISRDLGGGGAAPENPIVEVPVVGIWRFANNSTMADPGAGLLRTNNPGPTITTQVAISRMTQDGVDLQTLLQSLATGDVLECQDETNIANRATFTVSATATDNGSWFLLPVTYVSSVGTTPSNNDIIKVSFSS
jgi:hypothetical protein